MGDLGKLLVTHSPFKRLSEFSMHDKLFQTPDFSPRMTRISADWAEGVMFLYLPRFGKRRSL